MIVDISENWLCGCQVQPDWVVTLIHLYGVLLLLDVGVYQGIVRYKVFSGNYIEPVGGSKIFVGRYRSHELLSNLPLLYTRGFRTLLDLWLEA